MKSIKYIVCIFTLVVLFSCNEDNENGTYQYSTSLFVATDRHETGDGNNLAALLRVVMTDSTVVAPQMIILGGDYVGSGPDRGETGQPSFSMTNVQNDIDSVISVASSKRLFVYGSHDKGAVEGYAPFFSGPYRADGYYVYGISYAQMAYGDSTAYEYDGLDLNDPHGACAKDAARDFDRWIASLNDHAPIVMMSHIPMHANRNDNQGGEIWYQSISKAAMQHGILLLFGHNHTTEEYGNGYDQSQYLLIPGDSIITQGTVTRGEDNSVVSSETYRHQLNFSYGNAGYMKLGYGTLITFTREPSENRYSSMTLHRYTVRDTTITLMGSTSKPNPYVIKINSNR